MDRNKRSRIYLLLLLVAVFIVYTYRSNQAKTFIVNGKTMGTIPYQVKYIAKENLPLKPKIDSLLKSFNQSLSTYIPDSEISQFNKQNTFTFSSPYFYEVLKASQTVYEVSDGLFDPTVSPLVDAWGFGSGKPIGPDSSQVDSLLQYVGFEKIEFNSQEVRKKMDGLQLNFSAIAKGQAIDMISNWLVQEGIDNFMVEIGGEVFAKGRNEDKDVWTIGIEVPNEYVVGEVYDALPLDNRGMATSGNYRNFSTINGQKVSHTINPKTGFPERSRLLSATVVAPSCMLADAYATACMAMGLEKSKALAERQEDVEIYLIYTDESENMQSYFSSGLQPTGQ